MRQKLRSHLTFAKVISLVALSVALGEGLKSRQRS
jgi:hypothetical protein